MSGVADEPAEADAERPTESPDGAPRARQRAHRSLGRFGPRAQALLDRYGAEVPVRPAHVHYPEPPRLARTIIAKIILGFLLAIGAGACIATEIVASVGHGAAVFGQPLSPGIYFPTDIFGWLHLDGPQLSRADVNALNAAGVVPSALHRAFGWAIGVLAAGVALGVMLALVIATRPGRIPKDLAGLKGTAEWASYADVVRAGLVWDGQSPGVFLGYLERPPLFGLIPRAPAALVYRGPRHILQNAASRSGKDVGTNTITATVTWHTADPAAPGCSMLWNDPKGEGHLQTSGVRRSLFGNDIVRFAPLAPKIGDTVVDADVDGTRVEREEQFGSTRWNALAEIPLGTDFEFADMLQIATLLVDPTGKLLDSDQGHWIKTSRTIIKALAIKVLYDPLEPIASIPRVADLFGSAGGPASAERDALHRDTDGAPPGTIEEMLEQFLGFNATGFGATPSWLTRAFEGLRLRAEREIMLMRDRIGIDRSEADALTFEAERRRALDRQIERLRREMRHPDLERDVRNALRIRGEEASSVYSTVNANLTPWLDPVILHNTSFSDAKILDLVTRERPVTWYVVSSIARADMAFPIVKLFWTLALRKLVPEMAMNRASKRTRSPWRHNVLLLMNERGSLKTIEVEQDVVPVAASYGLLFDYLFQTPRQLREIGGDNDVIGPNCGIQVWHTPQEFEDQEALSKRLGNRTVVTENVSHADGRLTRSWQTDAMPLMTPEQTAQIPTEPVFEWTTDASGAPVVARTRDPAYQVIFAPNCRPIYARKAQWFTNDRLRAMIAATSAVPPYPLRTDRTREILFAADEQARTSAHRIETTFRTQARIEEAIRLERIPAPERPVAPDDADDAAEPASAPARKRRVVAADHRLVARVRAEGPAHPLGRGFETILAPPPRHR